MDLIRAAFTDALRLILSLDGELIAITLRSLTISSSATLLASLLAVPLGLWLGLARPSRLRRVAHTTVDAGMALPPVLVGLLVMLLLWRTGPFGNLRLLYTSTAMALAQGIVAFPVIAALTRSAVAAFDPGLLDAMRALGATPTRVAVETARMMPAQISTAVAAGFGRALAEVGASLMVGANIAGATRVLTTAITLEAGRGEFALAMALGLILLLLALFVNFLRIWLVER